MMHSANKWWFLYATILISLCWSSESFIQAWMFMEITNISFIIWMLLKFEFTPSIPMIFLAQSFSSPMILLYSINPSMHTLLSLSLGIMIKMGLFPFDSWLCMTAQKLEYTPLITFLTLMKIPPLFFAQYQALLMSIMIIMMSSIMIPLKLIYSTNIKTIIAMSSTVNSGWMLTISMMSWTMLSIFMVNYMLSFIVIIWAINTYTPNKYSHHPSMYMYIDARLIMVMMMGMMTTMPPTIMFTAKIMTLTLGTPIMMMILIPLSISSAISMIFYLRLMFKVIYLYYPHLKSMSSMYSYHNPQFMAQVMSLTLIMFLTMMLI